MIAKTKNIIEGAIFLINSSSFIKNTIIEIIVKNPFIGTSLYWPKTRPEIRPETGGRALRMIIIDLYFRYLLHSCFWNEFSNNLS